MVRNANPPVKTTYVKFFAAVNGDTVGQLLRTIEASMKDGTKRVHLMLSSPGGSVFHGLSAYNFMKGLPIEVITHNFGSVDSIGVVLFAAGSGRLCVPHARFLLHGVSTQFPQGASLEEPQLEERLKGMRIDTENIAGILASTIDKAESEVTEKMLQRTTLSPEEAIAWGLVTEIREDLVPEGAEVISIEEQPQNGLASQVRFMNPPNRFEIIN
jgi:ATP-dependent protease ClpP protease subunit